MGKISTHYPSVIKSQLVLMPSGLLAFGKIILTCLKGGNLSEKSSLGPAALPNFQ